MADYLTVIHECRDFATWKKAYDVDAPLQKIDDDNNLLIIWAVADAAKAKAFFESPSLAAHMAKNAGVIGQPEWP